EAAKAKRGAAAEELKAVYPEMVNKLTDLLARIREIDAEVRHVNESKPHVECEPWDGLPWLLPTECEARGVTGFKSPEFSLDRGLVLPDFNEPGKKAWPPYEVPLAVQVALAMRGY